VKGYNLSEDAYSYLFCNQPDHTVERQEEDKTSVRAYLIVMSLPCMPHIINSRLPLTDETLTR